MSLEPGAAAQGELILQLEAPSQLLEMIPSGPRALPPAARSPRMPFPEGGWHRTTEMSPEATIPPLYFNCILGEKCRACNIYCFVHMEKEPSIIL